MLSPQTFASGHPTHEFGEEESSPMKGVEYTGAAADPSPGGVPMEAMSDVRCEDGMTGIFPCHKVDLASFTPLTDLGAT